MAGMGSSAGPAAGAAMTCGGSSASRTTLVGEWEWEEAGAEGELAADCNGTGETKVLVGVKRVRFERRGRTAALLRGGNSPLPPRNGDAGSPPASLSENERAGSQRGRAEWAWEWE